MLFDAEGIKVLPDHGPAHYCSRTGDRERWGCEYEKSAGNAGKDLELIEPLGSGSMSTRTLRFSADELKEYYDHFQAFPVALPCRKWARTSRPSQKRWARRGVGADGFIRC